MKVALTTAACPLRGADRQRRAARRSRACRASRTCTVEYDEMTQEERSAVMQRARLEASQAAPPTGDRGDHPCHRDRQRQGRRRQVVDHREPRGRPRGPGPHRRRARRRHLGLLHPPHARRARAASPAPRPSDGKGKITPAARCPSGTAVVQRRLDGPARRRRGHRADVARADPRQGARAVPHRREVGRPRLPAHRHAARHRRHPDGARPAAAAGRDARRHDAGDRARRRSPPASPTWRAVSTSRCSASSRT